MPSVPFLDANFFNAQWAHQGIHHQFARAIVRIQNICAFPHLRHGMFSRCPEKWGVEWGILWCVCTHRREQTGMQYFHVLYVKNYVNTFCTLRTQVGVFVWTLQRGWSATRLLILNNFDSFSGSAAGRFIQHLLRIRKNPNFTQILPVRMTQMREITHQLQHVIQNNWSWLIMWE